MFARLAAAQVGCDLGFHVRIDRFAEIVAQQDVFGGNSGVGFKFEDPVAVIALLGEERVGRARNRLVEGFTRGGGP